MVDGNRFSEHPRSQNNGWHVPEGQGLRSSPTAREEGKAGALHTVTHWKIQILHDLSKHLVFIQTLLPFHNTGYFSPKGNSCPINKGRWEGAWGRPRARARQMQKAFPGMLQLTAEDDISKGKSREGPRCTHMPRSRSHVATPGAPPALPLSPSEHPPHAHPPGWQVQRAGVAESGPHTEPHVHSPKTGLLGTRRSSRPANGGTCKTT